MSVDILHPKKILLINDKEALSSMILMLIRSKGYRVYQADGVIEAFDKLQDGTDLIIVDLLSRDEDIFRCCQLLKTNERTAHLPVLVLSAAVQQQHHIEVMNTGIEGYISKPFESKDLISEIEKILTYKDSIKKVNELSRVDYHEEIKLIIEHKRIVPVFQGIYYLNPKRIMGVEMLVRPQTATLLSNPEFFFTEALKAGLYMDVEMLGWQKALDIIEQTKGVEDFSLCLNCNPYLIEHDQYRNVTALFNKVNILPNRIYFEITERSAIREYTTFCKHLNDYRLAGFNLAVDDVGGGYASLETIVKTKPQMVKIDKHLITGLKDDPIKRSIVKLLVAFCHENAIICLAEGVETKEDLDIVTELGVDAGQGYFLSRPKENLIECLS